MNGHPYLIKGIPKALYKEFRIACLFYDITVKDHLISCMSEIFVRYHRARHDMDAGSVYRS